MTGWCQTPILAAFRPYCGVIDVEKYVKNVYLSLFYRINMVMTGKNCSKSLIFQSVSMAMVHGFSGSDLEPVSSGIFLDDLCIIFGMCILIPYNDWSNQKSVKIPKA